MSVFSTPILLIVFNRPEITQRLFDEIKKQKPRYLYFAADAPRKNRLGDVEKCAQTRAIIEQIDWDCELKTLFHEKNLGVAHAPSTAITWFFQQEERGLIFEDDCIPHQDFFSYSEQLLERYKDSDQIMHISGLNMQNGIKRGDYSYYFSAYAGTWGWATWRKSWANFDLYLKNYSLREFKKVIKPLFPNYCERMAHIDKFILVKKRSIDAWDYQYMFQMWREGKLEVAPNANLISNIGNDGDATHNFSSCSSAKSYINVSTQAILPLKHPQEIVRNCEADDYYYKTVLKKNLLQLAWRWVNRHFLSRKMF